MAYTTNCPIHRKNSVVEKNRKFLKMNKKRKRKRRLFTGVRKLQETVLYHVEKKKQIYGPVYGWGSTASRLQPLLGGILLFTTKFPEIPGTHFIDLKRMKS